MPTIRTVIDEALKDLIDQVPTMTVERITLTPADPVAGENVTARIDVSGRRYVLCKISTTEGLGHATLHAARVIES